MDENEKQVELQEFFKALSDMTRLKIVGLLMQRPYSVEELSALVGLRSSTVSHHLSVLSRTGLVCARGESYYRVYELDFEAVQEKAQRLLSEETFATFAAGIDLDAYDREVLEAYLLPDGRLKQIPSQRKKLDVILRFIFKDFEADRQYTEAEVNAIIAKYSEDIAGLRRDLIEAGMLKRDKRGSAYWVAEPESQSV
jgi:predicted transcriptional regulator